MKNGRWLLIGGTALVLVALVVSGIDPFDRATWVLEVAPAAIALPILWLTRKRFPLTPLLYALVFLHALVLIYGGAYSYARVPLGFEIQAWFDLGRNPYDKIGHVFQGLVPALLAREILIRGRFAQGPWMVGFLAICVAMTVSAGYELIEWGAAVIAGGGAVEFLGTQGDPWDAQSDMLFALLGAVVALVTLARWQDRQIRGLGG
ncbi:DUF2238 domain-containing protein [Guyparkeria halophila]|uniref:DUF2238 domain-containing protein n=1 Tax=Guyparkeria halophila TaxID=47960 RepID=A0ABZ0YY09_9GAMM|nr:DUF2238 domain-containing protein [Guyparkeria halophila]WQH17071.1 DUF2238 domain-containing protein [Guyparkeria halophila]